MVKAYIKDGRREAVGHCTLQPSGGKVESHRTKTSCLNLIVGTHQTETRDEKEEKKKIVLKRCSDVGGDSLRNLVFADSASFEQMANILQRRSFLQQPFCAHELLG